MIILQLVISTLTVTTMWLAGSESYMRRGYAWRLALCNQVLWTTFIIQSEAWGLFPLIAALSFVYARNLYRWSGYGKVDSYGRPLSNKEV